MSRTVMSNQMKVSIITPVYNVSAYLSDYMESVLNQTMRDIEIIMVDDCSTDDSVTIIKDYQKRANNIILLENEVNVGASKSRDRAIRIARGDYLFFVDADDIVSKKAIETLYNIAKSNDADITIGGLGYFLPGEKKITTLHYMGRCHLLIPDFPVYTISDKSVELFEAITNTQVCKLIRRDIVEENNISNSDYRYSADIRFSFECMMASDRVIYVDKNLYYYRQERTGNISLGRVNKKPIIHIILLDIYEFLKTHHYSIEMEDAFWRFYIHKAIQTLYETMDIYKDELVYEISEIFTDYAVPFYKENKKNGIELPQLYLLCWNRVVKKMFDKDYGRLLYEYRVENKINPLFTKFLYKRGRLSDFIYDDAKIGILHECSIVYTMMKLYIHNHLYRFVPT